MPQDDKNEAKERVAINDQKHSFHIKATAGNGSKHTQTQTRTKCIVPTHCFNNMNSLIDTELKKTNYSRFLSSFNDCTATAVIKNTWQKCSHVLNTKEERKCVTKEPNEDHLPHSLCVLKVRIESVIRKTVSVFDYAIPWNETTALFIYRFSKIFDFFCIYLFLYQHSVSQSGRDSSRNNERQCEAFENLKFFKQKIAGSALDAEDSKNPQCNGRYLSNRASM